VSVFSSYAEKIGELLRGLDLDAAGPDYDKNIKAITGELIALVDNKARGDKLFPKPWLVERCGEEELIVTDAIGTKLFYIMGDEGDGADAKPSVLFHSDVEADTDYLIGEIMGHVEQRNRAAG
jgi:hypothetical protein